jgi:hypothetical protein
MAIEYVTDTMKLQVENLPEAIREAKEKLRRELPGYARVFEKVENEMRRNVAEIVKEREAGETVIPVLHYSDIAAGAVTPAMISKIRDRGACIIRETFAPEQARAWDDEIGRYVEENGLTEKLANAAEDKYFGNLAAAKPQIYGIYWSRPQVQARQSESLTRVRVFLNRLWVAQSEGVVISTRIRRRRTPTGSAGARREPVRSGSRLMWTVGRLSGGLGRISEASTATSSRAISKSTTLSMQPSGRKPRSSRPPRSVPCFGPSRAGRR